MENHLRKMLNVALLLSLIILSSCEKDLYDEIVQKEKNVVVKSISLKELSKTDNSKLFASVNKLRNKRKDALGKIIFDSINNLYFDDENGKYIEKSDGYKSYTFPILKLGNTDQKIENIVFSLNENGEYDTYKAKYDFTKEEMENFSEQQITQHNVTYTEITEGRIGQIVCIVNMEWQVASTNLHGFTTQMPDYNWEWVATSYHCYNMADNTGSFSGGGGDTNGPIGAPSTSSTSNGQSGGGSISTTPIPLTPTQIGMSNFMSNFNNLQLDWYNNQNDTTLDAITNYLAQNNFSIESQDFMNQTISNISVSNNTILNLNNFDNNITTTNVPQCLQNLVNSIKLLQNGKFGQVISQFAGTNPVPQNYNWNITVGTLSYYNPAHTTGTVNANTQTVTTTINSSYLNTSTNLSLVKTLIHECFHAYLVSVYRYKNIDTSYVNLLNTYYSQFNNSPNDAQHHFFAQQNIVNEIGTAIFEYGINNGHPNLTLQYCQDLAWSGLEGTNAFNNLPISDRERIQSVLFAEFLNSSTASENILGLTPIGVTICP